MFDVFISYRRDAAAHARDLEETLKDTWRYEVFRDEASIAGGDRWNERIVDALENSRAVVVLLSPGCLVSLPEEKAGFRYEIARALERRRSGECQFLPYRLSGFDTGSELQHASLPEDITELKSIHLCNGSPNSANSPREMAKEIATKLGVNDEYIERAIALQRATLISKFMKDGVIDLRETHQLMKDAEENLIPLSRVELLISQHQQPAQSLPPAQPTGAAPARAAGLNASQLAERVSAALGEDVANRVRAALGVKSATGTLSNVMVNALLQELEYQTKDASGAWRVTGAAGGLGTETTTAGPQGVPVPQVRWDEGVVPTLVGAFARKAGIVLAMTAAPAAASAKVGEATTAAKSETKSASDLATKLGRALGAAGSDRLRTHLGLKTLNGEISAQMVNALLEKLQIQVKTPSGWALTTAGAKIGVESVGRGTAGEAVRMLRWTDECFEALAAHAHDVVGPTPEPEASKQPSRPKK